MLLQTKRWLRKDVVTVQRGVKQELDQVAAEPSSDERLHYLMDRIDGITDPSQYESGIQKYVYGMSALVHHSRFGGLKRAQINRLQKLLFAILQVHQIQPESERLAFLHGDIHLVVRT